MANGIARDSSNVISNYKLCLVGNSESLISDICANGDISEYTTISNEGFGVGGTRLFTHLLSVPNQQSPSIHPVITDPLRISYWNSSTWNSDISINVNSIQDKINWCNNYIKTYSSTSNLFTIQSTLTTFGYHTLGLINNNVRFPSNGPDATRFLQILSEKQYGTTSIFNPPTTISPISGNNINIFLGTWTFILNFKLVPDITTN
uniref:AMP-binding protein n=1 Tax=Nucleocytoviricota sp. TaxID=2809609 RepID=A0A9E8JWQ4_9VIRU|nr:AMP-binding protein [Nucleocytoviricota sp.]UZT29214.1 AMP-binding protein [Nucleocytoviricota sp.]